MLVPAVSNGMSAPLNDVALAAFGNAAIYAWIRGRDHPSWRASVLSGVLIGLAIGVKYPALVLGGLLGLGFFTIWLPLPPGEGRGEGRGTSSDPCEEPIPGAGGEATPLTPGPSPGGRGEADRPAIGPPALRSALAHVGLFGVVAVLVGGGWYLRAYIHTGNPVYPFFRQVFGGAGIDEVLDPIKRPMAVTAWNLLTALGPVDAPARSNFDSFSHQFGPVVLAVPARDALVEAPSSHPRGGGPGLCVPWSICLTQRQSMRFGPDRGRPDGGGRGLALASDWWERRSVPGRLLIGIMLTAAMSFEAALSVVRARHGLSVIVGRESAESFLQRREPTFAVGRWMAGNLPEAARVVGQDHRGFYLPRAYSMELAHRRRTGLGTRGDVGGTGRREAASGRVHPRPALPAGRRGQPVEFDPTLGRLLASWLAIARPLYREDLGDADGVVRRYAIYALEPAIEEARR